MKLVLLRRDLLADFVFEFAGVVVRASAPIIQQSDIRYADWLFRRCMEGDNLQILRTHRVGCTSLSHCVTCRGSGYAKDGAVNCSSSPFHCELECVEVSSGILFPRDGWWSPASYTKSDHPFNKTTALYPCLTRGNSSCISNRPKPHADDGVDEGERDTGEVLVGRSPLLRHVDGDACGNHRSPWEQ